jgi:uroporphyrinogen decarboxylase
VVGRKGVDNPLKVSDKRAMSGMTIAKPLLGVLAGERQLPPPVWLMRQAGRYLPEYRALRKQAKSFLDFCFTPDLAVEATLQPLRRFAFDAAILFSDILVIPHALGQHVSFEEGEGPRLKPVHSVGDIDRLSAGALKERLAPVFESLRRLRRELPPRVALIGFAGAPWTVAAYMVEGRGGTGFETAKKMARGEPTLFGRLIDLLVEQTIVYLSAQIEAGAEVIQIFDSWAGDLDEEQRRRWSLGPLTRIVSALQAAHPQIPVILFPRGAGDSYAGYAQIPCLSGLSLDSQVDLGWAARTLQSQVALQGNLDPELLVAGGPSMRQAMQRILEGLGQGPLIFNLGHGILPQTPLEHVAELVELVHGRRG